MSGGGIKGAKPAVDIKTKKAGRDPVTNVVKRESDVAIKMKVDLGKEIKIGMRVEQAQAATVALKIVKPATALTKEPTAWPAAAGTVPFELAAAFPVPAGSTEQWVAWTGFLPGHGQVNKLDLETELEIDGSAIPAQGFQMIPVIMTYRLNDLTTDHYLVDSSVVPGQSMAAIPAAIAGKTKKKTAGKAKKKPAGKKASAKKKR
jgi:hypothetical protein